MRRRKKRRRTRIERSRERGVKEIAMESRRKAHISSE
jgi:hypothetical protein